MAGLTLEWNSFVLLCQSDWWPYPVKGGESETQTSRHKATVWLHGLKAVSVPQEEKVTNVKANPSPSSPSPATMSYEQFKIMGERERAICHFCLWKQTHKAHENESSFSTDTELAIRWGSQDKPPSFGPEEPLKTTDEAEGHHREYDHVGFGHFVL